MKNILVLTKYGSLGASSRMRFYQYNNMLKDEFNLKFSHLISSSELEFLYSDGKYNKFNIVKSYFNRILTLMKTKEYDFIWIQAESLPYIPYFFEKILLNNKKYILDFDDAIFHNYDLSSGFYKKLFLKKKIDLLMRSSSFTVSGNQYLASRAISSGCSNVAIVPTVVDLELYKKDNKIALTHDDPIVIGWIGTKSTSKYLDIVINVLDEISQIRDIQLKIIGSNIQFKGISKLDIVYERWTQESEVSSLHSIDVGLMPLIDSAWERGKCGYKLIQYMACGKPVIASPVGCNVDIVTHGQNGFLASNESEWKTYLLNLIDSQSLRVTMGKNGFHAVESEYCLNVTSDKLVSIFNSI